MSLIVTDSYPDWDCHFNFFIGLFLSSRIENLQLLLSLLYRKEGDGRYTLTWKLSSRGIEIPFDYELSRAPHSVLNRLLRGCIDQQPPGIDFYRQFCSIKAISMSPGPVAPPTPQEVQRKLSVHSVSRPKVNVETGIVCNLYL